MFGNRYTEPDPRLVKLVRWLSASFRVGRFFGVEVRVFWVALVLLPAILLWEMRALGPLTALGRTAAITGSLFLIIYTHEMGHIAAGWRYGIPSRLITISPMGGLAHMSAPTPRPSAGIVVSLAGPAVHLVWLAAVAPFHFYLADTLLPVTALEVRWYVQFLWEMNLALMLFNLLPFFPMDGGGVLRALFAMRMHPNRATVIAARVGMVGAVGIGLFGLYYSGMYGIIMVLIGITNFGACRRELLAARYQISPFDATEQRPAWAPDPDAWKHAGSSFRYGGAEEPGASAPRESGRLQQWISRRREDQGRELEAELDRLLIKIQDQGMGSLTRAERRTLKRAAEKKGGKRR